MNNGIDVSTLLNFFFGVALTFWGWQLRVLNTNVKELAFDLRSLAKRMEDLATRVTVIEVKQSAHQ